MAVWHHAAAMGDDRLTRAEAEAIFRRATEIEAAHGMDAHLDLATLEQIAGEVGLSRQAVRQAALEIRTGGVPTPAGGQIIGPRSVCVARTLDAPASRVLRDLDAWCEGQQLRVRRRAGEHTTWEKATGLAAGVARAVDFNKQLRLKDVNVVVCDVIDVGDGRSHVRIELDFSAVRNGWVAGIVAGGVVAAAVVGTVLGDLAGVAGAVAGVVAGGGGATGGLVLSGRANLRQRQSVEIDALENLLDELELPAGRPPSAPSPLRLRRRR